MIRMWPRSMQYALGALGVLATAQDGGERLTSTELSQATGIPPAFLSKNLRKLVRSGLLDARKGYGGGFSLAKPATEINLLDVLVAVAPEFSRARGCIMGRSSCDNLNPCPLHDRWKAANTSLETALLSLSVAHLKTPTPDSA